MEKTLSVQPWKREFILMLPAEEKACAVSAVLLSKMEMLEGE